MWKIFKKSPYKKWLAHEPRCSVCGLNTEQFVEKKKAKNPNAFAIGNLIGVCPTCRKSYCIDHALPPAGQYGLDNQRCPKCSVELDFYWDRPASPHQPWRIGPKPEKAAK